MVLVYILTFGVNLMGSMLPYIAAPWILWGWLVGFQHPLCSTQTRDDPQIDSHIFFLDMLGGSWTSPGPTTPVWWMRNLWRRTWDLIFADPIACSFSVLVVRSNAEKKASGARKTMNQIEPNRFSPRICLEIFQKLCGKTVDFCGGLDSMRPVNFQTPPVHHGLEAAALNI